MPIYEYRCSSCGHELEALQKFSERAARRRARRAAPTALVKQVSAAGFQLKGSGWYATDFKRAARSPPAKPTTATTAPADAKAATPRPTRSRERFQERRRERRRQDRDQDRQRRAAPAAAGATTAGTHAGARASAPHDEALSDRRPARLGAARHHDLGAALPRDDARPDAAARARKRCGPRRCVGFHIPGLGVVLSLPDPARHRRHRRQLLRRSG